MRPAHLQLRRACRIRLLDALSLPRLPDARDGRAPVAPPASAHAGEHGAWLEAVALGVPVPLLHHVPRAVPRPELGRVILRRRRQHVAHGVPGQAPHRALVRAPDRGLGLEHAAQPEGQGAVAAAADEQVVVDGVPFAVGDVAVLAFVRLHLPQHPDVEDLEHLVPAPGEQEVPVGVPVQAGDSILVAVQRRHLPPPGRVPELHHAVLAPRGHQRPRGVPLHALDVPAVGRHGVHHLALREVPDLHRGVVAAGGELEVGGREGDAPHGLLVRVIQPLGFVEGDGPVLDDAAVVPGEQPGVVVRPRHAAHGLVVSLDDRLEVEAHAVPERELPAVAPREQPPPPRRP
mmetsp:Transcript_17620/g.49582  ORF Transcript_17620/g.49582 Transcript_17620/m.49582 type:complete len:346 (-) Transcript_17620:1-1038(-)